MAERWSYLANKEAAFHVGKGIFLRRDDDLHDDDSTVKADA
jgi:hypothetical protein